MNAKIDSGRRVAVIGAGIIGASIGLRLQREGFSVTLVDGSEPGRGASFGNAGSLSTGSCVPIALPGMIKDVPKWLADPLGPLAVRWSYLPRATPWLVRWLLASRRSKVEELARHLATITRTSVDDYKALLGDAEFTRLIRKAGQLHVSRNQTPSAGEKFSIDLRVRNGVDVMYLDAAAVREMEPALSPEFVRGVFLPTSGHVVSPLEVVRSLVQQFTQAGGQVMFGTVHHIEPGNGRPGRLMMNGAGLDADMIVIAAGAFSAELSSQLGDKVPLDTERGYHTALPDPGLSISRPIQNLDDKFFASPIDGGLRLVGTVEIAGLHAKPNYERARTLLEHGRRMFPGLREDGATAWMGFRPSIPDSLPLIDRSRRHANVFYAFGHGHIGLTAAPITAELITDMLLNRPSRIDRAPFSLARF